MTGLARRYKLIFFDQRASGRSSNLVDTSTLRMSNFVEDVEGVRKAFKLKKVNLLGHSWGGLVAMFYLQSNLRGQPDAFTRHKFHDEKPADATP